MVRSLRGVLTLALVMIAASCATNSTSGPASQSRGRTRANLLTYDEIRQRGQYSNLYDLIQDLRPRWLRSQGPDTLLGQQGQVQVHMDGNLLGGVEILRRLNPAGVTSIEFMAPIDAAARYGLNHSHGAIIISTGAGGT
jgi:hypothetical protein